MLIILWNFSILKSNSGLRERQNRGGGSGWRELETLGVAVLSGRYSSMIKLFMAVYHEGRGIKLPPEATVCWIIIF